MAARSASELLPRPFDDLKIEDVRQILEDAGESGESLFLEWKSDPTPEHLAKASAAFANTYGGLLIGGVTDETREIVGFEPKSGEIELWVKEVLRARVLPLPPFRARALPAPDAPGHVVLLVLVEESSTTPHLMAKQGTIYVRNPGSSDPRPIQDQGLLLDLMRRGRESRNNAVTRAREAASRPHENRVLYSLGLAPTGVASDVVADLFTGRRPLRLLDAVLAVDADGQARPATALTRPVWTLNSVEVQRITDHRRAFHPRDVVDAVVLHSDSVIQAYHGYIAGVGVSDPEPRGLEHFTLHGADGVEDWFATTLRRLQQLLLSLGAHGDLHVVVRLASSGRHVFHAEQKAQSAPGDFTSSYWTTFDGNVDEFAGRLHQDLLRWLGLQPELLTTDLTR